MGLRRLLIPRKTQDPVAQPDYGTDMRAIEQWAANVGGIIEIVAGSNVTIDNGFGPVVTVNASGGGGGYASLTGTGETNPIGTLTQTGPFNITDTTNPSTGIDLSTAHGNVTVGATAGNVTVAATAGNVTASSSATSGLVVLQVSGASGVAALNATGGGSCEMVVANGAHVTVNGNGLVDIGSANTQNVQLGADNLVTTRGRNGTQVEPTGGLVGFYGATPHTVIFVTGSRGGNAALDSLLTTLATLGLIVDSTTP